MHWCVQKWTHLRHYPPCPEPSRPVYSVGRIAKDSGGGDFSKVNFGTCRRKRKSTEIFSCCSRLEGIPSCVKLRMLARCVSPRGKFPCRWGLVGYRSLRSSARLRTERARGERGRACPDRRGQSARGRIVARSPGGRAGCPGRGTRPNVPDRIASPRGSGPARAARWPPPRSADHHGPIGRGKIEPLRPDALTRPRRGTIGVHSRGWRDPARLSTALGLPPLDDHRMPSR